MSEFQYVGFRAIDAPLTDQQLAYMENQSTRAEITRWSFDNEYHYGDFRGNAAEMLRRGYDIHLHYANFGIRKLMIRLPQGLPLTKAKAAAYLDGENVEWKKDKQGSGGILTILPDNEPGSLEELWDVDAQLDQLVGLRQQLLDGDLRPLYAAWLCGCQSDYLDPQKAEEPPVPAGLAKPTAALVALVSCYDLNPLVLAAAAEQSPPLPDRADQKSAIAEWLKSIDAETLREWTLRSLTSEAAEVRSECLQAFRKAQNIPAWPVKKGNRTLAEIRQRTEELIAEEDHKEQQRQARARKKRLRDMAKSPDKFLKEVDNHVARRGRDSYEKAAETLSDLREAIGGEEGETLVRKHAAHLKKKHPTLNMLSGALRRQKLL